MGKKKVTNCTSNLKFVPVLLTPLTLTPFSTFESLKFSACGMHTLASADAIWWAICITNHCITVHIDLWGDWKVKHTLIQYCIRRPMTDCLNHLISQNFVVIGEGEHPHREAFEVGWHGNIILNWMEDCHMGVIAILTTSEKKKNI